jgi:hypothetical protein
VLMARVLSGKSNTAPATLYWGWLKHGGLAPACPLDPPLSAKAT